MIIIKSGVEMMIETLNDIMGQRTDPALVVAIKKTITEDPEVYGAYDLFLYNYGPDKNYGSVHVEVNDTLSAVDIDALDRRIQKNVYLKHGVILTGIGLYARNTTDGEAAKMKNTIMETVMAHDYAMSFHGFYADFGEKFASFDVVLSFECDRNEALKEICSEVQGLYPDWGFAIQPDVYITDD